MASLCTVFAQAQLLSFGYNKVEDPCVTCTKSSKRFISCVVCSIEGDLLPTCNIEEMWQGTKIEQQFSGQQKQEALVVLVHKQLGLLMNGLALRWLECSEL